VVAGEQANWSYFSPIVNPSSDVLSPSGALIFELDGNGLEVYDANHGDLKQWVAPPENFATGLHLLTVDDSGQRVFAITQSGFTIFDFTEAPLSIAYARPNQGTHGGGTSVTIRGSGFQSSSTVLFGTATAATTFVDGQTLTVVTPAMTTGATRITIQNADGQSYALDDGFTAQ
jgi:streptogramin lyase